jgi:hypothetical protein
MKERVRTGRQEEKGKRWHYQHLKKRRRKDQQKEVESETEASFEI